MANHISAKQRIQRNARRAAINGSRQSAIRTFLKKVELAIAAGNPQDAEAAYKVAQPHLMRGVAKGLLHKNTAARKMSRLTKRIKALKA
ncbi:MAG: 30S ribosomal protein S20 [Micavibrio sp.]